MNHPPVHPQPSNHTPVGTENPVRHLHPLQGYNHKKQKGQQPNQPHGVHLNTAGRLSKGWGPPLTHSRFTHRFCGGGKYFKASKGGLNIA